MMDRTGGESPVAAVARADQLMSGSRSGPAPEPPGPPLEAVEKAQLEAQLRALVPADADSRGILTNVSVLEDRSAADAILQGTLRVDADVVALASHGRSGLKRAVLGSVAEEVARRAPRPVLLVHVRRSV